MRDISVSPEVHPAALSMEDRMTHPDPIKALVGLGPELQRKATHSKNGQALLDTVVSKANLKTILAAISALTPIAERTSVLVPVEPTEAMLHACQAAMKNFIRDLSPEERANRGWKPECTGKHGYRIKPYEKAKIRYRAMIAASPSASTGKDGV